MLIFRSDLAADTSDPYLLSWEHSCSPPEVLLGASITYCLSIATLSTTWNKDRYQPCFIAGATMATAGLAVALKVKDKTLAVERVLLGYFPALLLVSICASIMFHRAVRTGDSRPLAQLKDPQPRDNSP